MEIIRRRRGIAREAFTLIEVLVVVAIIGIFLAIAVIGWQGADEEIRLRAGERMALGLMRTTRGQAILQHTSARLIIHRDLNEPEKYLRFLGVVYRNPEDPNGGWVAATQGVYLPKGIYFDNGRSDTGGEMKVNFPWAAAEPAEVEGGDWLYYEYNSRGLPDYPGRKFVLGLGWSKTPGQPPVIESNGPRAGFVINRNGRIFVVRDPSILE